MRRNLFYILLLAVFVTSWYKPPADPDFGWHFKYGEYLFKNGHLLKENVFSYNFADYEWANSYWISQLYFYITYTFLTPIGMGLLTSILGGMAFLALLKVAKLSKFETVFYFLILATMGTSLIISVRPLFFSSIFLLLTFVILDSKPRWERYLPLVFLVWANTHADFTLGLLSYGLFTLQRLIEKLRSGGLSSKSLFSIILIPVTSVLVTLINPYGIGLWETLLKETHPAQFSIIAEWIPIDSSLENSLFIVFLLSFGNLIVFLSQKRDPEKTWAYVFSIILALLSIRSAYFIRPTLLITGLFSLSIWDEMYQLVMEYTGMEGKLKMLRAEKIVLPITAFCFFAYFARNIYLSTRIGLWSDQAKYPYDAIQFVKEDMPPGNMFNSYNWGGYLIWQLPEYKTFIDGRMASWSEDDNRILTTFKDITEDPENNMQVLEKAEVTWAMIPTGSKLAEHLQKENWKVGYEDDIATVMLR